MSSLPENLPSTINGIVIGIVESVTDPLERGRVTLTYPTLGFKSNWARVASFFAGAEKGAFFPVSVGDEVLVAFELGNINRPYVIGALWNGVDQPPVPAAEASMKRMLKTKTGLALTFNDDPEASEITLSDASGNSITLNSTAKSIDIVSTGDISLTAADGKIALSATEVSVTATAKASMSATEDISVEAPEGIVSVTGSMIKLN